MGTAFVFAVLLLFTIVVILGEHFLDNFKAH